MSPFASVINAFFPSSVTFSLHQLTHSTWNTTAAAGECKALTFLDIISEA